MLNACVYNMSLEINLNNTNCQFNLYHVLYEQLDQFKHNWKSDLILVKEHTPTICKVNAHFL